MFSVTLPSFVELTTTIELDLEPRSSNGSASDSLHSQSSSPSLLSCQSSRPVSNPHIRSPQPSSVLEADQSPCSLCLIPHCSPYTHGAVRPDLFCFQSSPVHTE